MDLKNKQILITCGTTLKDIQLEFSACYPFLKIEFHSPGNTTKGNRSALIDANTLLKQLANANIGSIDINSNRTVAEVSQNLQQMLGVPVKVSRKSGNVWSTISISDGWTLQSQNVAGKYISSEMAMDTIKPPIEG